MIKASFNIPDKINSEGYLNNTEEWNKDIAVAHALLNSIELNEEHWFVINYLRQFYQDFPTLKIPNMRIIIKRLRENLGEAKGNSLYFQRLFPQGLLQAYKIAGLPKTGRCKKELLS